MNWRTMAKGGHGERISYNLANSPLGRLLVAGTGEGICAVALGDSDAALLDGLRRRFPAAVEIEHKVDGFEDALSAILGVIDGSAPAHGLSLHVHRTAFQERAWTAMAEIPRGQTRTYGELAFEIGSPRAAIAVGDACARNPLAVLIPCHRVLAADRRVENWRWGTERKRQLLALEDAGLDSIGISRTMLLFPG